MPILTTLGLAAALASTPTLPAAPAASNDPAFSRCLAGLQATAATQGIGADRFNEITTGLTPDPSVLGLLDAQPEFTTPIWDYLAALVDRQRVDDGRTLLQQHRDLLDRVSAQYGVDPAKLDGLVSVVLLGIADPDNFDLELKNAFGLTDEKAKVLAAATEEAIWKNIKGKIKEVIAKEEMAKKVEGVFVKLDQEKYGTKTISALEETKAAEVARKTLLEEKLKGQFSLPASQSVVAPPIGTAPAGLPPIGKPAAPKIPVAPPTAPAPQIDPYREKPI